MSDLKWLEEIEECANEMRSMSGVDSMFIGHHVMEVDKLTKVLRVAIGALEKTTITLANCDQHCLSATRANDDAVKALAQIEKMGSDGE